MSDTVKPAVMEYDPVEATKQYISYNNVHQLCQESTSKIQEFNPDLIIAIGGGGFIPARMLRTFLKTPGKPTLKIYAIILSLYEDLNSVSTQKEEVGVKVVRQQWIDYKQSGIDLVNKKVLIVDEVDDTRTTLHYAVNELKKDVLEQCKIQNKDPNNTQFGIFVLHDKQKLKKADIPKDVKYFAARQLPDVWIAYPWESTDIVTHTRKAIEQGNDVFLD